MLVETNPHSFVLIDMKVYNHISAAACLNALIFTAAVILQSSPALSQGEAPYRFDDERLKATFSLPHQIDLPCYSQMGFEGLRSCFSGTDSLEQVLLDITSRRDLFLEKEPDPFLEEQPKIYWYCEVFWKAGSDGSQPSFHANVFPIDGNMELYSIELRLSQEP